MKRLLAVIVAASALAVTAAPSFATPQTDFTVSRVLPNDNEIVLATYEYANATRDDVFRTAAQEFGRLNRTNNPAWHIVIYCPTDNPDGYTVDDRCWDSQTDL